MYTLPSTRHLYPIDRMKTKICPKDCNLFTATGPFLDQKQCHNRPLTAHKATLSTEARSRTDERILASRQNVTYSWNSVAFREINSTIASQYILVWGRVRFPRQGMREHFLYVNLIRQTNVSECRCLFNLLGIFLPLGMEIAFWERARYSLFLVMRRCEMRSDRQDESDKHIFLYAN
ncbi:hypothetical protein I7I50_09211 [Histoplasma capsulatum G186AR]|uniref:Uncharacterized protein n=1 Tax=Ajellomyces capsulatus TaxID=5037 RepID=A0A8H7YPL7_AJECA|nr:hypothetical protein I7I52_06732 [Histoplasma capsulatum]QSS74151.1 hypothetical protein I7I50_09211 [Histoplasma capsulatum G186AR]